MFTLQFTQTAKHQLKALEADAKKLKKVRKTLGLLETNPRHPGLHTHLYSGFEGPKKEKVFEAYVENNTPAAWRVFFYYVEEPPPPRGARSRGAKQEEPPAKPTIMIVAITDHP